MKRKNNLLLHTRAQVYPIISILSSKREQNPARGLGLHVLKHIPNLPPTNSLKRGAPILSHLFLSLPQELVCLDLFFCSPMLSRFSTVSNVCELSRILR